MQFEFRFKPAPNRHHNERNRDNGKHDVSYEYDKVDGSKPHRFLEIGTPCVEVIHQVGNEKDRRCHDCGDHAIPMRFPVLSPNEKIACAQKHRTQGIQAGIDHWKVR